MRQVVGFAVGPRALGGPRSEEPSVAVEQDPARPAQRLGVNATSHRAFCPLCKGKSSELANGQTVAFARLWDAWKDRDGHWLQSFTIVTTEANEKMSRIHPRMPVILHARDYDRWLDREETEQLPLDLLRPYESDAMEVYETNPQVGNVRNNGPEMMRAAAKATEDGELPL